jgi:hypothetical protein
MTCNCLNPRGMEYQAGAVASSFRVRLGLVVILLGALTVAGCGLRIVDSVLRLGERVGICH